MQLNTYETNAIAHWVAHNINANLLTKAPVNTTRQVAVSKRVAELGPTIVAMENQGIPQTHIAAKMKLSRTSVSCYSDGYRKVLRDGLI